MKNPAENYDFNRYRRNFATKCMFLFHNRKSIASLFSNDSYLKISGWHNSCRYGIPVDEIGSPIPWVVYSFLEFIKERLKPDMNILEYGTGQSTLFWAKHVRHVTGVEHNEEWFKKLKENLPTNVCIYHTELDYNGMYCRTIERIMPLQDYHIIVVDGRDRINCVQHSLDFLSPCGVFVLDNSERENYRPIYEFLSGHDFRWIDFWGFVPGYMNRMSTTIFYRDGNCLFI